MAHLQPFAGNWVRKPQLLSMQTQPWCAVASAVKAVADDGMPDGKHVYTQLVRAASDWLQYDGCGVANAVVAHHLPMGLRWLAQGHVYLLFWPLRPIGHQGQINRATLGLQAAVDNGRVPLERQSRSEQG